MTNTINTNEVKPSNKIILTFNELELVDMYQADEYDYSPNDLTVEFDLNFIDNAKKLFEIDPDLFSVKYWADISSEDYEGKVEADFVQIFKVGDQQSIYACFCNGYSGTSHEIEITDKVFEAIEHNKSTEFFEY